MKGRPLNPFTVALVSIGSVLLFVGIIGTVSGAFWGLGLSDAGAVALFLGLAVGGITWAVRMNAMSTADVLEERLPKPDRVAS